MKLFSLETHRKTDLRNIARAVAVGVAVAVPLVMFIAPLIAERQMSVLSAGDKLHYGWTVESVNNDGTVTAIYEDGTKQKFLTSEVVER